MEGYVVVGCLIVFFVLSVLAKHVASMYEERNQLRGDNELLKEKLSKYECMDDSEDHY